jgi:uncharacterized protein YjdB
MKKFLTVVLVLILTCYLIAPQTVYAAKVKISKSKVEMNVGDSKTLELIGATGTTKWTSSNKKVVSISEKGKLTANTKGKATITATD